ncbi:MAG: GMC family oxidoreductase [Candidatus Omnitrophica bacterium]|nr:GMC family oxidoreductase [Candidatus Omnitrophota bacterium]
MNKNKFDYIIVGGGTAGLALAKELCLRKQRVLVLEKGYHHRFIGHTYYAGFYYDHAAVGPKSRQGIIINRTINLGGTSLANGGNAVPSGVDCFKQLGINLSDAVDQISSELNVNTRDFPIGKTTRKIIVSANRLGLDMVPMPKFGTPEAHSRCCSCGNCILGCKYGAKWSSLDFLKDIDPDFCTIFTGVAVKNVIVQNNRCVGVEGRRLMRKQRWYADRVILSAGGLGTPVILQNSGIDHAGEHLFVDLLNVTYGILPGSTQFHEVTMNIISDKFYQEQGFILTSFIDNIVGLVSTLSPREYKYLARYKRLVGVMTKIKDTDQGKVYANGTIDKTVLTEDAERFKTGNTYAREILLGMGIEPKNIFVTRPRGAHPGGTAGIGRVVDNRLETEIKDLFVCDTSVFPHAFGLPPILTLLALSRWFVSSLFTKSKETVELERQ